MTKKKMTILGLTGSIGMGKTTTSRMFEKCGAPVFNADKIVHDLLSPNGAAFLKVLKFFPEARSGQRICRKKLGTLVFENTENKKKLEALLHPFVWKARRDFLVVCKKNKFSAAILDIPLLFETEAYKEVDKIICVTASYKTQKARVLKRKHMTEKKFRSILKHQTPDKEKRNRADYIISTEKGLADTRKQVAALWKELGSKA